MSRFQTITPLNGDVFTQEALDSLVGQTAPLTATPGDVTRPIGRAEVIEARQEGDLLVMVIETTPPEREQEHLASLRGHIDADEEDTPLGIGFTIADAAVLGADGHREFKDVRLRQFGPSSMPFTREDVDRG